MGFFDHSKDVISIKAKDAGAKKLNKVFMLFGVCPALFGHVCPAGKNSDREAVRFTSSLGALFARPCRSTCFAAFPGAVLTVVKEHITWTSHKNWSMTNCSTMVSPLMWNLCKKDATRSTG